MTASLAIIGDPISQSLSPAMHNAALTAMGMPLNYVAVRVSAEMLPTRFAEICIDHRGFNVTRPLKEAILPLVDKLTPAAVRSGSVNTVLKLADGTIVGDTTDGAGLLGALARAGVHPPPCALILGTGGAARAVAAALVENGTSALIAGRNWSAGTRLVSDLREADVAAIRFVHLRERSDAILRHLLHRTDLVINATPLGGVGHESESPLPRGITPPAHVVVCDLVSVPRRTVFLNLAERAGCRTIEGVEILVEQGARSFTLWTATDAPISLMRDAALKALSSQLQVA